MSERPMRTVLMRVVLIAGVMLLGAPGPASAGSLPSAIERCLGLRPNQDLPSVIERRYGLRPNQPLPSAVERDILRQCRYGYRHHPYRRYGRYDRYDPYNGWHRSPPRGRYRYEYY
jgi:hypothetical protein